jgi:hypothetical protein
MTVYALYHPAATALLELRIVAFRGPCSWRVVGRLLVTSLASAAAWVPAGWGLHVAARGNEARLVASWRPGVVRAEVAA